MRKPLLGLAVVLLMTAVTTGCATKKYVQDETQAVQSRLDSRIDDVEGQVEENQTQISQQEQKIQEVEGEAQEASKTAQEALERATEAGKLAEGKFVFETVLTDDKVKFGFDKATLSDEAQAALDQFIQDLKSRNENVFIEIQGHTDSIGTEQYNEELGMERARAVRQYLGRNGVPLHRMEVISYGESSPIADNGTRDGRAQNRRVALVVLK